MSDQETGTEIIAREIAMWHGSHITGPTRTIASEHGFGSWGHSAEKYADRHWREYIGSAEAMLARINNIEITSKAREMRNAIDMIKGALMGLPDFVDLPAVFEGTAETVKITPHMTVGQMRQVCKALEECTRIINSDEYLIPSADKSDGR